MLNKINAIDLFCGVGGLTKGLSDANINVIAGFDIVNSLKATYENNNVGTKYLNKDVSKIEVKDIKNLTDCNKNKFLLAGCAPCQPFSTQNKNRKKNTDHRRTLIYYFANLIRDTSPDFVFMENVPGLEKLEPDMLDYFIKILNSQGYSWDKKIVDAASYGAPQHRKRFVLMAAKTNKNISIPIGSFNGKDKPFITVRQCISHLPKISAGETHTKIKNHKSAGLSDINKKRIRATKKSGGGRLDWHSSLWLECHKNTSGYKDVYGRIDWDKPSPTLTTRFYGYSCGRYGHPDQDRALSIKEGALLQTFPNDYIFEESNSMESLGKQIGNAVPPKMAKVFGEYFMSLS
jgi:DNA (cytosine-5)-methyltransferase 1